MSSISSRNCGHPAANKKLKNCIHTAALPVPHIVKDEGILPVLILHLPVGVDMDDGTHITVRLGVQ